MSYNQTIADQTAEIERLIQLRDRCHVADFSQWVEWGDYHWEISDLTARRDALRASIDTLYAADRTIIAANARCIAAHVLLTGFARRSRRLALAGVTLLLAVLAGQLLLADAWTTAAVSVVLGLSLGVGVRRARRHEQLSDAAYAAEDDYVDALTEREQMLADIDNGRPASTSGR
ncbi:hypothetical protein ACIA5G_51255 [Amycolatopsis sp. NPDC051758]|uniref:hypothetical protein n=1 Tax=Amycolatopsis sp. NPDC051758 TaxID=3363935 RepID=UPI00378E509D